MTNTPTPWAFEALYNDPVSENDPVKDYAITDAGGYLVGTVYGKERAETIVRVVNRDHLFDEMAELLERLTNSGEDDPECLCESCQVTGEARALITRIKDKTE